MTMAVRGAWPWTAREANRSGSAEMTARPFTRKVVPEPGIRNSSATRGSRTMFDRLSIRLLPRRSGITRVRGPSILTAAPALPRGLQSCPTGPTVARATKGEASIRARQCGGGGVEADGGQAAAVGQQLRRHGREAAADDAAHVEGDGRARVTDAGWKQAGQKGAERPIDEAHHEQG